MTKKQKRTLWRILLSAALLAVVALLPLPTLWLPGALPLVSVSHVSQDGSAAFSLAPWVLYLVPYLLIGWDVLWKAVRNIAHGQVFDENFLMAIATRGGLCHRRVRRGRLRHALLPGGRALPELRRGQVPAVHRLPDGHPP